MSAVTEEYRCGYCWQEFLSMDDPRELPCTHVFCISCLQADHQENEGELSCPYCQQVYKNLDFSQLNKSILANRKKPAPKTTLKCDMCKDQLAVSYCVTCTDKVCDTHGKSHDQHFGDKHRVVPINIFEQSPENFRKPICEQHNETLIRACSKCDKMICADCDKFENPCVDDKKHTYCHIGDLDTPLIKYYRELLKKADDKVTDICKLEKHAWGSLDDDDVTRKRLIQELLLEKEQKIRHANEVYTKVVAKVKHDQDATTHQVETYNAKLVEKKEAIDAMRLNTRKLMLDGSVSEKVRQRKDITHKLEELIGEELGNLNVVPYKLPPVEDILFEDKISSVTDPDRISITEGCDLLSKKTCYDIETVPAGHVLLAGNRSFDICNRSGGIIRTVFSKEGDFTSIQYYKGKVYTLLKEPKGSNKRRVVVFDGDTYEECLRWDLPEYGFVSMLAVSNDKVYVVDNNSKNIKVYTLTGAHVTNFSHASFRNPVYMSPFHPNGVLLADWSAGVVYKIDSVADKVDWSFKVPTPRGVYCDKLGNVWVWSSKDKALYLRSADGKKMKKYHHKKLVSTGVEYICGFFLGDDKLWGAACGRGVVRVQINISPA